MNMIITLQEAFNNSIPVLTEAAEKQRRHQGEVHHCAYDRLTAMTLDITELLYWGFVGKRRGLLHVNHFRTRSLKVKSEPQRVIHEVYSTTQRYP